MPLENALPDADVATGKSSRTAAVAWLVAAVYYFYQYALRSAPSVMMPQLSHAFGLSVLSVASIVGLFYYGYSPFSLVAGVALDRLGPRKVIPIGAAAVGIGALLFAAPNGTVASVGRLLQGAGGVFALVGAIYIATSNFSSSKAASLIGATQMFGMAGGAAGQFVVGPMIGRGLSSGWFWLAAGIAGLMMSALLLFLLPKENKSQTSSDWLGKAIRNCFSVLKTRQSILCGLISGLLFIPTTIFDMIWGVRYLQEGHGFAYASAVLRSAMVPLGWIIGCPLLGFVSDQIGRRKPVIIGGSLVLLACLAWILYGPPALLPPYVLGIVTGTASGAAMLPYTVIKEANSPQLGGTATGVINFLNFTLSALLAPVFAQVLQQVSNEAEVKALAHYQATFAPLLVGVAVATILTAFLSETGPAVRMPHPRLQQAVQK